jgi:hypothetical protein
MRGSAVNTYRVYFFDAVNHIIHARNFEAVDDAEAVTRAGVLCQDSGVHCSRDLASLRKLHRQAKTA